jgi:hypothetical protein
MVDEAYQTKKRFVKYKFGIPPYRDGYIFPLSAAPPKGTMGLPQVREIFFSGLRAALYAGAAAATTPSVCRSYRFLYGREKICKKLFVLFQGNFVPGL